MSRRSTARNSFLVTIGSICNVLLGLAFQLLLAHQLGVSSVVDDYTLGTMIPTLVATIMIGSTPSVLVPAFTRALGSREDSRVPVRLVSAPSLAALGVTGLVIVGSLTLAPAVSPSLPEDRIAGLTAFLVLSALAIPFAWLAAVSQSILILNERFLIVGLAGAVNGLGLLVVATVVLLGGLASPGLGWAFIAGYVVQAIAQGVAASRHATWERVPSSRAVLSSLGFLLGSALVYKSQPIIERTLAAYFAGGPASLAYSSKITQALLMASSLGIALVSLPALSRHVSNDDYPRAKLVATRLSLAIAAISAPLVTTALLAPDAVVSILYERGAFGPDDVSLVALVLAASAAGVFFSAVTGPVVNLLYAADRYRLVATVSVVTTLLGGLLSWALRGPFGLAGIVAGSALVFLVNFVIYWVAAGRSRAHLAAMSRVFIMLAAVGLAGWAASQLPSPVFDVGIISNVWKAGVVGLVSAAAAVGLYVLFDRLAKRSTVP